MLFTYSITIMFPSVPATLKGMNPLLLESGPGLPTSCCSFHKGGLDCTSGRQRSGWVEEPEYGER